MKVQTTCSVCDQNVGEIELDDDETEYAVICAKCLDEADRDALLRKSGPECVEEER